MVGNDVNLLPENVIERLYKQKLGKEKLYFLISIALTLVVFTALGLFLVFVFKNATTASENLISDQKERLEQLNDLWNQTIVLNKAVRDIPVVYTSDLWLQETWDAVTSNLIGLQLLEFVREDAATFKVQAQGNTPEASTQFLLNVSKQLPTAKVKLDSIRHLEDSVLFNFLIVYE